MNDILIYFTQIIFYLEDSIKEIFIDYIEQETEFLSIDFSKVERNYWFCKLILKSRNIKKKFLKKINDFRKNFKLPSLKSCTDNDITKNEIYFEEFENKDWLGENIQILRPINIKNFIIYDNNNFKLFNPTKKLLKINASYAFGTGYHFTTRHCIETLYECSKSKKFQNILDYGSGSGILGIAAKKLMPYSKITLIDNDNLAVKMSKFNLKKNNIISNNNVLEVSASSSTPVPLVKIVPYIPFFFVPNIFSFSFATFASASAVLSYVDCSTGGGICGCDFPPILFLYPFTFVF